MNKLLVELARIVARASRTTAGRLVARFANGLSRHTAGKHAVRGVEAALGRAYRNLSKQEQWVVDQITEAAVRVAANFLEDQFTMHFSEEEIGDAVESETQTIVGMTIDAINSRVVSLSYDTVQGFVFGKMSRDGKIIVQSDIIKQALLAAIAEIVNASQRQVS